MISSEQGDSERSILSVAKKRRGERQAEFAEQMRVAELCPIGSRGPHEKLAKQGECSEGETFEEARFACPSEKSPDLSGRMERWAFRGKFGTNFYAKRANPF